MPRTPTSLRAGVPAPIVCHFGDTKSRFLAEAISQASKLPDYESHGAMHTCTLPVSNREEIVDSLDMIERIKRWKATRFVVGGAAVPSHMLVDALRDWPIQPPEMKCWAQRDIDFLAELACYSVDAPEELCQATWRIVEENWKRYLRRSRTETNWKILLRDTEKRIAMLSDVSNAGRSQDKNSSSPQMLACYAIYIGAKGNTKTFHCRGGRWQVERLLAQGRVRFPCVFLRRRHGNDLSRHLDSDGCLKGPGAQERITISGLERELREAVKLHSMSECPAWNLHRTKADIRLAKAARQEAIAKAKERASEAKSPSLDWAVSARELKRLRESNDSLDQAISNLTVLGEGGLLTCKGCQQQFGLNKETVAPMLHDKSADSELPAIALLGPLSTLIKGAENGLCPSCYPVPPPSTCQVCGVFLATPEKSATLSTLLGESMLESNTIPAAEALLERVCQNCTHSSD